MIEQFAVWMSFWPLVVVVCGLIAWGFKLEFNTEKHAEALNRHDVQISELKTKQDQEIKSLTEQISLVRESLARIEGALGVNRDR